MNKNNWVCDISSIRVRKNIYVVAQENEIFNHSFRYVCIIYPIILYSHITENVPSQGLNLSSLISFRAQLAYIIDFLCLINSLNS